METIYNSENYKNIYTKILLSIYLDIYPYNLSFKYKRIQYTI